MKRSATKKTGVMAIGKIAAGLMLLMAMSGCKKEQTDVSAMIVRNYEGQWENIIPAPTTGPLDFFHLTSKLHSGGTGTLNTLYIQYNQPYTQTNLTWQKISSDSIVIDLDIPAYPNEKWQLRGISDVNNTKITADYYSIPDNDASAKHKYGTMVLIKL